MLLKRRFKNDEFIVQLQHGKHFFEIGMDNHTSVEKNYPPEAVQKRLFTIFKMAAHFSG